MMFDPAQPRRATTLVETVMAISVIGMLLAGSASLLTQLHRVARGRTDDAAIAAGLRRLSADFHADARSAQSVEMIDGAIVWRREHATIRYAAETPNTASDTGAIDFVRIERIEQIEQIERVSDETPPRREGYIVSRNGVVELTIGQGIRPAIRIDETQRGRPIFEIRAVFAAPDREDRLVSSEHVSRLRSRARQGSGPQP